MLWIFQYIKSFGRNLGKVSDNLFRGAHQSKNELEEMMAKYNLRTVIDLRDDLPSDEKRYIEDLGLTLKHFPMKDNEAPTFFFVKFND